uniref:Uncharacterized protein n=1 Tax=Arundo donax TaxID=35708 RepID=A0A0A9D3J1_ARUDO
MDPRHYMYNDHTHGDSVTPSWRVKQREALFSVGVIQLKISGGEETHGPWLQRMSAGMHRA